MRARRKWRWLLGSAVGLLVLGAAGLLVLLGTAADRAVLVRRALAEVNGQISGRIELERAWLFPNGHFVAHDVAIYDPAGRLVIRVAEVDTHVDLLALASGRIHLQGTVLRGVLLQLSTDSDQALNISRAFQTPRPAVSLAPGPAGPGRGLVLDIDRFDLALDEARFDLGSPAGPAAPFAELRHAALHGAFALDRGGRMTLSVQLTGAEALAPLQGPFDVTASLEMKDGELGLRAVTSLDDARLRSALSLHRATGAGEWALEDARVGPHLLEALLPSAQATGARGTARLVWDRAGLRVESLEASPAEGPGIVRAEGTLAFATGEAKAQVFAEALDAEAFSPRLPPTSIGLSARLQGARPFDPDRHVSLHADLGPSSWMKEALGPGTLDAQWGTEGLTVSGVDLALPGGRLRGGGRFDGVRVSAQAHLQVSDARSLGEAVARISSLPLPTLVGALSGTAEISGTRSQLALRADVQAPRLALEGVEAEQLSFHLEAPRISRQMAVHGVATLAALRIRSQGVRDVAVTFDWTTPRLWIDAQAARGQQILSLRADALVPAGLQSATVTSLILGTPADTWSLTQPARLDFAEGFAVDRFRLSSGAQQLSLSADLTPGSRDALVVVNALDLSRLPGLSALTGRADGRAHYRWKAGSGALAETTLTLDAAVAALTGPWSREPNADALAGPLAVAVECGADAQGFRQRLTVRSGQSELLVLAGSASVTAARLVALLQAPQQFREALLALPFDERLTMTGIPLGPLLRAIRREPRVEGSVSGEGSLAGTLQAPRGTLRLSAEGLSYANRPIGPLVLTVNAEENDVRAQATVGTAPAQLTASLRWVLSTERLLDLGAVKDAPLTFDVSGSQIPLATVLGGNAPVNGSVDLSGQVRGSLLHPRGSLRLALQEIRLRKAPAGDLSAEARFDETRVEGSLSGQQPGGGRVAGRLLIGSADVARLGDAPLTASLDAEAFDLSALSALTTQGGSLRAIGGHLDAHLTASGTLRVPRANGSLDLSKGTLALAGLGQLNALEAHVAIADGGADIRQISATSAGGTLRMTGTLRPDPESGLRLQSHLETSNFGVYGADQLIGSLSSSEELTGTVRRSDAALTLNVTRAEFKLPRLVPKSSGPTTLDPDIVVGDEKPAAVRSVRAYALHVQILAPETFQLSATDLQVTAGADVDLSIQGDIEALGSVRATHGEITAYGRRLTVEHADITFGSGQRAGPIVDPDIDARAEELIEPYRLFIDVKGHPRHLRIVTSTEPPLGREQVGRLLVSGSTDAIDARLGAGAPPSGGLAAASALGGLFAETLRDSLGPYMPLDVLTVEPTRFEAGKRITPQLYLGAVEKLGATDPRVNGAEIHANFKLSRRWSLDSRYGTARAGNLDLQWTQSW